MNEHHTTQVMSRKETIENLDLQKIFLVDLKTFIQGKQKQGHQVVLPIDANEGEIN